MIDNSCFIKRIKKRVLISIEWTLILYLILDPLLYYPTHNPHKKHLILKLIFRSYVN